MPRVYLSIGSNIDRERNIRSSLAALRRQFGPLTVSRVYESAAVGFRGAPFYNLAVGFDTDLSLDELAGVLDRIEHEHGRERGEKRFDDRTLDLDILIYGELVRHDADHDIPRGELTEYAHVLAPLAEIAPDLPHPESGRSIGELWEGFDRSVQALRPVQFNDAR
jgi:2-amino-4-hydroxy-6-hydroxymethyldihydropteridine diphosphokinase